MAVTPIRSIPAPNSPRVPEAPIYQRGTRRPEAVNDLAPRRTLGDGRPDLSDDQRRTDRISFALAPYLEKLAADGPDQMAMKLAIVLQQLAIATPQSQTATDVCEVLQRHLEGLHHIHEMRSLFAEAD